MKTAEKKNAGSRRIFGKRFRAGSYSAFAAVLLIAIAVVANMLAGSLPASVTQLDLTEQALYSISDQTKKIANSLDKDVTIYLLSTPGSHDDGIDRLIANYDDLSDHIAVVEVDVSTDPTFIDRYDLGSERLYINSLLVECGEQYRFINYTDIYVTTYSYTDEYSYDYTTTTEFDGENALTNAIHYVSSDDLPKLYMLSGHGEAALGESIEEMLAQDNIATESLSLLTMDAVPEDADAIFIHAPTGDLGEDEADMLISWLEQGGSIMLVTNCIESEDMPNLLRVTQHMGLNLEDGLVIEGDSGMHLNRYPHYMLPNIESHEITEELISGGYYVLTPMAQAIVKAEDNAASVNFLLTTSESAYNKADGIEATTTEQEDGDAVGQFNLAACSENTGKLCWFSSATMLDSSVDRTVAGANSDLLLNAVNWMCGQEENISIRSKSLENSGLYLSSSEANLWSVLMIGVFPLACILLGVMITIRRKRK